MPSGMTVARGVVGAALLAASLGLAWRGATASIAFPYYHAAKYGAGENTPDAMARLGETSLRFYADNYHLCILVAETAYHAARETADVVRREKLLDLSAAWCVRGLVLNPFKSQLRYLNARSLQRDDPAAAAAYWADFVDWEYWHPHNHYLLVEFYCTAGALEQAELALEVIEGREPHFRHAEALLRETWLKQEERLERERDGNQPAVL